MPCQAKLRRGVACTYGGVTTYTILDTIASLPQDIVLQIQQLESSMQVLDEVADLKGALVVAQRDRVDCETGLKWASVADIHSS